MGARAYLAAMAAAAVLPVLLVAGFVLNTLLDAQRAAATRSVLESARAISLAMDQELATAETVLRVLASSAYLSKRDLGSFPALARAEGGAETEARATEQQLSAIDRALAVRCPLVCHAENRGSVRVIDEAGAVILYVARVVAFDAVDRLDLFRGRVVDLIEHEPGDRFAVRRRRQ